MASAGPSVARTQGGPIAALWGQLRTKPRAASAAASVVAVVVGALLLASPALAAPPPNGPSHEFTATFGDGNPTTPTNLEDPYPLAGPAAVAVDQSNGDIYVANPSVIARQGLTVDATGGTFSLSFEGQTTPALPYDATAAEVQAALEALAAVGAGNLTVSGGPSWIATGNLTLGSTQVTEVEPKFGGIGAGTSLGVSGVGIPPETDISYQFVLSNAATETASDVTLSSLNPYTITFTGALTGAPVAQITANSSALTGSASTATVTTIAHGVTGNDVEKFNEKGEFLLMFGKDVNKHGATEAQQNVCAKGEECQPGASGPEPEPCQIVHPPEAECPPVTGIAPSQFDDPAYLAVDNSPGGNGDIYVGDPASRLVQKFEPSGHILSTWGVDGQKDGSDITEQGSFEKFYGLAGLAVTPHGTLKVLISGEYLIWSFTQSGTYIPLNEIGPAYDSNAGPQSGLAVDSTGAIYYAEGSAEIWLKKLQDGSGPANGGPPIPVTKPTLPYTAFALDPASAELYQDTGTEIAHYRSGCPLPGLGPCEPIDLFGAGVLSQAAGLAVEPKTGTVEVADPGAADLASFADVRPLVTTEPPSEVTETSIAFAGAIDPETHGVNHGPATRCYFEWGLTEAYGHTVPCEGFATGDTEAHAEITGLKPITELPFGTTYHYRLLAENEKGATGEGADQTAFTTAAPQIEGVSSSHLTATSAQLDATIKPNGLPTTYRFQYGTTTTYGQTSEAKEITGSAAQLAELHKVQVDIEGLQPGTTYHFRLLAENASDQGHPVLSEDHNFEFFPPACPNSAVRQQTGSAYLPDCRAYELVSPANANATLLDPAGPATGQATSPSRLAYSGTFSSLPGTDTIETTADLYVATRTDTGWVSHYIGLPGSQASCMGGPPTSPFSGSGEKGANLLNDGVLTDPSMSHFIDFSDGGSSECFGESLFREASWQLNPPSNAPYLFDSEGTDLGRLPTDLGQLPGALQALQCPYPEQESWYGTCSGETTASPDLTHLIFSSRTTDFAEGPQAGDGLTHAPGSAYDDNLATGKVTLISTLKKTGQPIPQDPAFATAPATGSTSHAERVPGGAEEFLRFPAVSTDGSHVLISTATAGTQECGNQDTGGRSPGSPKPCRLFTQTPVHLYMSIDDQPDLEVSLDETSGEDVAVNYVGITPDGSRVYFTSAAELIPGEPTDTNTELYMWEAEKAAAGEPALTLISKPFGGADDTDECHAALVAGFDENGLPTAEAPWAERCDAVPYSGFAWSNQGASRGGNPTSDSAIAQNGDIYFYSPAQLDGTRGVLGAQNLYDYRAGAARYVTTLTPEHRCPEGRQTGAQCRFGTPSEGPILRLEISPDDTHMAFLTASRLTSYDNTDPHGPCQLGSEGEAAGAARCTEIYSYTPPPPAEPSAAGALLCDSCNPNGNPPTTDVYASQNGLFMTDDGRTFFSTEESLVPQDTNLGEDVYEYVGGRPQLITPGTGTGGHVPRGNRAVAGPGLIGVSANGTDVYFSTFDTLVSEDQNGNFLKFYDARTNGGFPQPPPVQPCAAAEECHGPATEPPTLPIQGTAAGLVGGNATSEHPAKHHKKHKKTAKKAAAKKSTAKHHHASANRGGKK